MAENRYTPTFAETPAEGAASSAKPGRHHLYSKLDRWAFSVLRFIIGGIFVYAAIPKIIEPGAFAKVIYNYQILPNMLVKPAAIMLPWLELFAGAFIILGVWLEGALIIYNLLMLIFIAALIFNTGRGLDIHCGCFSQEPEDMINMGTIIRDLLIFVPAAYLLVRVSAKPAKQTDDR